MFKVNTEKMLEGLPEKLAGCKASLIEDPQPFMELLAASMGAASMGVPANTVLGMMNANNAQKILSLAIQAVCDAIGPEQFAARLGATFDHMAAEVATLIDNENAKPPAS